MQRLSIISLAFSSCFVFGQLDRSHEFKIMPLSLKVGEQSINLPSGRLVFHDAVLAQVAVPWDFGSDLVIGYIPVAGSMETEVSFSRPQDSRVAKHNLDGMELLRKNKLIVDSSDDEIKNARIIGNGVIFSAIEFKGVMAPMPEDLQKTAQKTLDKFIKQRDEVYYPTEYSLDPVLGALCARLNGKGYLYVDYTPFGEPFGFFVDAFRNFKMGYVSFDSFDGTQKLESHLVIDLFQDLMVPRINTLTADHLKVHLETDSLKTLNLDAHVTYTDVQGGERYIYFDLFSDRAAMRYKTRDLEQHELGFGSLVTPSGNPEIEEFGHVTLKELIHYKRGMEKHQVTLTSVKDDSGADLRFVHTCDGLIVELPTATQPNQTFTLHFKYGGGGAIAQDFGNQLVHFDQYAWWPRPYRYNARPSLELSYKLPDPWIMIAAGTQKDTGSDKKSNWGTFVDSHKMVNPNVILGNYKQITQKHKGYAIHFYAYAQEKKITIKKIDTLAVQFLEFYGNLFGVVPFEEFSIIELASLQGVQHPIPGVIVVDDQTFNRFSPSLRGSQKADTNTFRGINESLAVGLAGLWWNSVVQPASDYDRWFGRGMSEYSAYMMMAAAQKNDVEDKFVKRWQARAAYVEQFPISHAALIVDYKNANIMTDLLQYKAAQSMHEIRNQIADDQKFVLLLSGFMQRSNFRNPSTGDFLSALSSLSGLEPSKMAPLFQGFK